MLTPTISIPEAQNWWVISVFDMLQFNKLQKIPPAKVRIEIFFQFFFWNRTQILFKFH